MEILIGRSIEFICFQRFRNRKVPNGVITLHSSWSCFCVFAKGENPLDIDFERAKN
jgi:hypothetical protein